MTTQTRRRLEEAIDQLAADRCDHRRMLALTLCPDCLCPATLASTDSAVQAVIDSAARIPPSP